MSYLVKAEWDDTGWWVVTVPDVPGAITQVKRLSQIASDAAEVIEIQTGHAVPLSDLKVEYHVESVAGQLAGQARDARRHVDQLTRAAVSELRRAGFSLRDTGDLTGISYQRAQQIEKELQAAGQA